MGTFTHDLFPIVTQVSRHKYFFLFALTNVDPDGTQVWFLQRVLVKRCDPVTQVSLLDEITEVRRWHVYFSFILLFHFFFTAIMGRLATSPWRSSFGQTS